VKSIATKSTGVTQEQIELIRVYLAQISKFNVFINEKMAEELQNTFVRIRKERGGQGIDEMWLGTRIVVAKSLTRIAGREDLSEQEWKESMEICEQWELRRK
jgi:Mini-chromosome maintenance replisome factor